MAQVKPIKKHKMSKPALIAMIVAIALLLAFAVALLAGSGFFFRIKKGASSDNFDVNASMMEYYANSYYQNWYSQNYYYLLLGYINFNPSLPLDQQYTDSAKTQTYYDYFVAGTKTTVETYLKYCEAAKADSTVDFGKLESEAKEYAKTSIAQLKEAAKQYSDSYYAAYGSTVTFAQYLKENFGQHVNQNDLKKALIIEHIASSYYQIVYDRINGTVDEAREDKYFEENLSSFVTAKYLVYTLSSLKTVEFPKAEDYVGGAESAAYKKAIEGKTAEQIASAKIDPQDYDGGEESQAYKTALKTAEDNKKANEESLAKDKAIIEKLAAATTAEEFKRILLEENFETSFTTALNSASSGWAADVKPSEASKNAYKTEELVKALIDAVLNEENTIDETLIKLDELKNILLTEKYAKYFENAYKEVTKDFTDEQKPTEEMLNAFNSAELKSAIIEIVMKGEGTVDEALLVVAEGASAEWAEAAKKMPEKIIDGLKSLVSSDKWLTAAKTLHTSILTNLNKVITNATKTGSYTLTTKLGQALFGGVKAQYGIEYEENETEGTSAAANTAWMWDMLTVNVENIELSIKITEDAIAELVEEIAAETDADAKTALETSKKTLETSLETYKKNLETAKEKIANIETTSDYSYSAYFVTEAAHRDEYKTRNVGHILFKVDSSKATDPAVSYKTSEEAKAAAEALLEQIKAAMVDGKISKEAFEGFASSTHDSNVFYNDVTKDTNFVKPFLDWIFEAEVVGNVGLVETTHGWHIMYYGGEAERDLWRVTANENATAEDVSAWYTDLPAYGIEFNDAIFESIFGLK